MGGNRIWARRAIVAGSCGVLVALAGCSAKTGPTATGAKASTSTTTGGATSSATTGTKAKVAPAAGPLAALTGLPVSAAVAQRPAVAVAVSGSDPVGLASADVVFAEMASPARYLAVYQSSEANAVGPVSGTRPVDGQALSVLHPLIGYDGGTTSFLTVLHATKVIDASYAEHASLYSSGASGLTVSTSALAGADSSDGPPPPLFSYRTPAAPLASTQETHPTSVRLNIPGQPGPAVEFRCPHRPLGPDLWRPQGQRGQPHRAGRPVPHRVPEPQVRSEHAERQGVRLRLGDRVLRYRPRRARRHRGHWPVGQARPGRRD